MLRVGDRVRVTDALPVDLHSDVPVGTEGTVLDVATDGFGGNAMALVEFPSLEMSRGLFGDGWALYQTEVEKVDE